MTSSPILLVARREVTARLQQKGYRIGIAATWVIVIIAVLLPKLIGGGETSYDIAVAGKDSSQLSAAIQSAASAQHATVHLHQVTAEQARVKVKSGDWDAAVIDDATLLVKSEGSTAGALVQAAHRSLTVLSQLTEAGLTPAQAQQAFDIPALAVTTTDSAASSQRQALATITVIFLFVQLVTFCTWVAMGVVEEKSSRVVELVLATMRPVQLLIGKLLGIGVLAVGQAILLGGTALVVATVAGTLTLPAGAYATLLISLLGFVLGFAFFAALAAALGSLVSRQEEVSGVLSPMTILLMAAYFASFAVASSPNSTFARVLSLIPPFSSIAMPARLARGDVPVLDVVASIALLVILTAAIVWIAGRIYRAAILHAGNRLSLRRAWRAEAVSELA